MIHVLAILMAIAFASAIAGHFVAIAGNDLPVGHPNRLQYRREREEKYSKVALVSSGIGLTLLGIIAAMLWAA
jgi:hypothetical protein